jgi:GDP/UDP-N,N'-diacetylbacillosamine 2-epimerase (hydrolysing)
MERLSAVRSLCYVSGTRADFGLMRRTLRMARDSGELEVAVLVTGMHLSPLFGSTVQEIEQADLRICGRIRTPIEESSGASMARATAQTMAGAVDILERERFDAVVVLGDRGEMLAGAYAAAHLKLPVIHIHGGERSGTIDEPVRHAISKLAHYHFAATAQARERLIRMGEEPRRVFVTGAPGLDELREPGLAPRADLCAAQGLEAARPVALVIFHPVLQEAEQAASQAQALMEAALGAGCQCLCFSPNSDAGAAAVRTVLERFAARRDVRLVVHLPRKDYISWLGAADVMIGNSSSGIIEAASLGLPVVNVGSRQSSRERSGNVVDVPAERGEIERAVRGSLAGGRRSYENVYGDGRAGERIVQLLRTLPLDPSLLEKTNAY